MPDQTDARSDGRHDSQQYGLPNARDRDGRLKPVEHTYEWKGQPVRIKFYPPTATEVEEWEGMGEDMSPSDMEAIVDEKLIKPDIEPPYSLEELACYVQAIGDYAMDDSELEERVDEELARRDGDGAGN